MRLFSRLVGSTALCIRPRVSRNCYRPNGSIVSLMCFKCNLSDPIDEGSNLDPENLPGKEAALKIIIRERYPDDLTGCRLCYIVETVWG